MYINFTSWVTILNSEYNEHSKTSEIQYQFKLFTIQTYRRCIFYPFLFKIFKIYNKMHFYAPRGIMFSSLFVCPSIRPSVQLQVKVFGQSICNQVEVQST